MTVTLTEAQLKQLDGYLGEIPSKYSFPVLVLLNNIIQAQQKEAADSANASLTQGPSKPELKAVPKGIED